MLGPQIQLTRIQVVEQVLLIGTESVPISAAGCAVLLPRPTAKGTWPRHPQDHFEIPLIDEGYEVLLIEELRANAPKSTSF
jgi:hypothetical protein